MKCCVAFCKSYAHKKFTDGYDSQIKFYQIPSNLEVREKWLKNIARRDWMPSDRSCVCSLHFEPDDFRIGLKISKLKPTAVPTIFPDYPKYMQEAAKKLVYKRNEPKKRLPPVPKPKINGTKKPNVNQTPLVINNKKDSENVNVTSPPHVLVPTQTENVSNDENVEKTNENNSRNNDPKVLHSAIHDHSLLFKQHQKSDEQFAHSDVEVIQGTNNLPKRGRPTLPYSVLKKQLYYYKKKVWRLNKKVELLTVKNKNLKEQLKEKNKSGQSQTLKNKKFCTVFCISADG